MRVGRWFKVQQLDVILQLGLTAYSMSLEAAGGPGNANQGAIGVDMGSNEFTTVMIDLVTDYWLLNA